MPNRSWSANAMNMDALSFHAVNVVAGWEQRDGDTREQEDRTEFSYQPPNAIRLLQQPHTRWESESIVIGERGWDRRGDRWDRDDAVVDLASGFLGQIVRMSQQFEAWIRASEIAEAGAAADIAGEPVRRFVRTEPDYGVHYLARYDAQPPWVPGADYSAATVRQVRAMREESRAHMGSVLPGVQGVYEVLVGAHTGRLYRHTFRVHGPKIDRSISWEFSAYGAVTVEPPVAEQ